MRIVLPSFLFSVLGLACNLGPSQSVAMQDSFELNIIGAVQEDLHSPYVVGASFSVSIVSTGYQPTPDWTLVSSDPSVVSVGSGSQSSFSVTAPHVGSATLSVVDPTGHVYVSQEVSVAQPDDVQLSSNGLLLAGYTDSEAQVSHANVVEHGTATFLVSYYAGGQLLYGNGAVQPIATGAATATTTTSSFGDDNDWVEISAGSAPGSATVSLRIGGQEASAVPVKVVPSSDIVQVGTLAESDANAANGDQLYVFARGFNASGEDVYGASYKWVANGEVLGDDSGGLDLDDGEIVTSGAWPSDVVRYTYESTATDLIVARLGKQTSSVNVHGTNAAVTSTEDTRCGVARGRGADAEGAFWMLSLAAASVLGRRHRA